MIKFWNSEKVFFDGDSYFATLIEDLREARDYITVEMYIFNDDQLGREIAQHLADAARRGVTVQIIVDGVGSMGFFEELYQVFTKVRIPIKMFNPLPLYHPYRGKLSFRRKLQIQLSRINKLNKRNHRKIITIDHRILYTGSFNITGEHTRLHIETPWKDMGVRVEGENVKYGVLNFKKLWKKRDYQKYRRETKKGLPINWRESPLLLNQTIFMQRHFKKQFIHRLRSAQEKIWFMTPYFIPPRKLIRILGKAAKRGVDVRILISKKSDVPFFPWLQYFYYGYLVKKGVKVYQYADSILHAKNFIIDDYITIGSTNLNHRSLMHDLEVDLVIQDEHNKKLIEEHFLQCSKEPEIVTLEHLNQRPLVDRILSRLIFLFKYWF